MARLGFADGLRLDGCLRIHAAAWKGNEVKAGGWDDKCPSLSYSFVRDLVAASRAPGRLDPDLLGIPAEADIGTQQTRFRLQADLLVVGRSS